MTKEQRELHTVYSGESPQRLDRAVASVLDQDSLCKGITRSQVKLWIEAGRVLLNGNEVYKAGTEVKAGDQILIRPEPLASSSLDDYSFPLTIVYEDEDLLVVDKPAGLTVHPGAGNRSQTMVNALLSHYKTTSGAGLPEILQTTSHASGSARPGIVHRLDKDTTGLVVVAKTLRALASLSTQFAERTVGRAYYALVYCTPRGRREVNVRDEGTITTFLARHPTHRKLMAVTEGKGKRAVTHWRVLERFAYACLLDVRLETGRTHQIRIHMQHIGSPVIGDAVYGNFSGLPRELRLTHEKFSRQALHAYLLEITHPVTGARMQFKSPLPKEMQVLIEQFRISSVSGA